jgi:hypothetical protein
VLLKTEIQSVLLSPLVNLSKHVLGEWPLAHRLVRPCKAPSYVFFVVIVIAKVADFCPHSCPADSHV